MKTQYLYKVEVDTASLFKTVKGLEDSINETMSGFGFSEKMVMRTTLDFVLSTAREATQEELELVKASIESVMKEKNAKVLTIDKHNPMES